MACPASGKITIQDLVDEFGGSAPHKITEYYRNGSLVPGNNTSVPESGQISLTQFYSAVNEILHTHSDGDTNVDLASIFGSNWASTVPKRVVVPSGVTVGGTNTHAMNVPSGMGGTLNIVVSGNIHGYGGAANGGNGGNAINCVQTSGVTVTLNSGGTIKAGGGGGGQGGTGGTGGNGGTGGQGGQGRYTGSGSTVNVQIPSHSADSAVQSACNSNPPSNYTGTSSRDYYSHSYGYNYPIYRGYCHSYFYTTGGAGGAGGNSGGAGGAGGAGGVGQGYNQSASSGSSGSAGSGGGGGSAGSNGGQNAGAGGVGGNRGQGGTGGTGGTGGSFGNSGATGNTGATGSTGNTGSSGGNGNYTNGSGGSSGSSGSSGSGGSSGGAAGYYIYNRASITFNNSGTVAGQ